MPEELPTVLSAQVEVRKSSSKLFIFLFIIFLVLFGIAAFLFVSQRKEPRTVFMTGLERDQIKLGWTSLSGVYPNNSNPPITDDSSFNDGVFNGLVRLSGSVIVPDLATKWTNPTNLIWRFDIRQNVKFQSGDSLTVEDVKYSFDQVKATVDSDKPWPSSLNVDNIKAVRIVDKKIVEIETYEPDPVFLNKILGVYIVSQAQIARDGVEKAVGTGAYRVVSYKKDQEAEVEINNNYWGDKPKVKKAKYIVFQTDNELLTALKKGEIDYARLRVANVKIPPGYQVKQYDEPRVVMLFFNFAAKQIDKKANPLLTAGVREAIRDSVDQNSLIKEASISGRPASQFLTKSIFGYNPNLPSLKQNLSRAKELLASAKVASLAINIYTTEDKLAVAEVLAKQLKEINVTATVKTVDSFRTLVAKLNSGEAQTFIAQPAANDGGEYIEAIFKSNGEQNILSYANTEVDSLTIDAGKNFVPQKRKELLEQTVEKIMSDNPVIPLYAVTDNFVISDKFDFTVDSFADFRLGDVSGQGYQSAP